MKKWTVTGRAEVVVSITIEAETAEEAIELAGSEFDGIHAYAGNGGLDKLIGVNKHNEAIFVDGEVEFDDAYEETK